MTIQDKKSYRDFRYKVSKSFVLCDKCSNKVPDGYYWTADGGSSTWIIEDGIDPIWGIIQSLNCYMCDECYVFNENKRETIRNLTMFASLGVKFDIFKKLIRNLDHWHNTNFVSMLT